MANKKLYTYEFSVLEEVYYEISVEAENYEQAEEKAREGIGHHKNQDVWDYEDTVENILCEGKESE